MRNYSTDPDSGAPDEPIGEPKELENVVLHSDSDSVAKLPADIVEIDERCESIQRQIKRLAKAEENVNHWKQVIASQTAERDKWNSAIAESKAMLAIREAELADRGKLTSALKTRLVSLQTEKLKLLVREFGTDLPPEFLKLLS